MDGVIRSIEVLDVKAVSDFFRTDSTQPQDTLFQHLVSSLKGKPKASHASAGKQLVYLLSLHGTDINKKADSGNSPLQEYLECREVHPDVVEAFLRCNADAYAPNKDGRTPFALAYFNPRLAKTLKSVFMQYVPGLWRAVEGDDVMNVRKLVNQWCHTNVVKDGKSLTQLANETGSESVVRVVRDIKPSMDLAHAVLAADVHQARSVLSSGEKVNVNFHNMGDRGATPLYYAILNNDREMVDLLLDNGARADIPLTHGEHEIPLFMSVLNGDLQVEAETLFRVVGRLSKNSITKMFFMGGNLLLHCINNSVQPEVAERILRTGGAALVTSRDQDNLTAREIAELNEKSDYVDLIDQVVSDWCFNPGADHSNRKLLCLHAYPYLPRVPKVSCHTSDGTGSLDPNLPQHEVGSPGNEMDSPGNEMDSFREQLTAYMHHIDLFHSAVERCDTESVSQLVYLEQYSQFFEPCLADSRTKANFQPALHKAVLRGDREMVRFLGETFLFLLGHRLDLLRDQFHRTALYYAMASEGSEDIAAYLAESGASEHVMDKDGRSPQVFKDRKGQPLMKKLLRYHLTQNFTQNEPDPWSAPLPVPIVGYIKKYVQDHEHGHGLEHHHHHHHHHHSGPPPGKQLAMAIQSRAFSKSDLDSCDSQDGDTEESETESNQGINRSTRKYTPAVSHSLKLDEQSSWCQIL